MLEAFWGLTGTPFDKSLKPDQLFISKAVKELLSRLDYMKQQRGIMLITGQPGAGKTTVLRAFRSGLSELSYQCFYVPLATVNVLDFYRQLNQKLGGESYHYKAQLLESIQQRIMLKYQLLPLDKNEVQPFIEHHLKLKGCQHAPFSDNAIEAIFKNTAGIPRLIAALAFHTMTLGMMQKTNILTEEQVFQAAHEL